MPFRRSALPKKRARSQSINQLCTGSTEPQKLGVAQAALRFANAHTSLGCGNQRAGHLSGIKPWTPELPDSKKAEKIIVNSRKSRENYFLEEEEYIFEVAQSQAGNCGEKSSLVCFFLSQQPDFLIYHEVSIWPADHTFVVMNQRPNRKGQFPDNFNDWNEDAVIIDPWLGICGPARHYPELWRMKLDTMAAVGVELSNGYGLISRKWHKANAELWQKMPESNKKFLASKRPLDPVRCSIL
ncbi:hypothetical protein [Candidatus Sororendozoicomonas aggregata]|uniref:hypothetical protein n=1 Tax=Candidatus Sororendozoicomonas aggregata TaxID=3073239 RepID=UPI002ED658D4